MLKLFKKSGKKGFTLIELLVVIAIIGVLASIVLASLNNARRKSRDARRVADIKQIQLGLELYFDSSATRQYAPSSSTCTLGSVWRGLENLKPAQLSQISTDPTNQNGGCYLYARRSDGLAYHLAADLEDSANPALPGANCDSTTGTNCPAATGASWPAAPVGFNGVNGTPDVRYDVTN